MFFANRATGGLLFVVLIALVVLEYGSLAVLWAERGAENANILTAQDALWYSVVTISTVGYGDRFPTTEMGRVFGALVIIVGVGVFGTLTGFLANAFLAPVHVQGGLSAAHRVRPGSAEPGRVLASGRGWQGLPDEVPYSSDPPTDPSSGTGPDDLSVALAPSAAVRPAAHFRSARVPSTPFFVAAGLGILVAVIFFLSASALFVFAVGVAIAFFLIPVVNWLERHGWPRWVAAIAAVVVTILGIVILGVSIIAILVEQGIAFVQNLPTYLDDLGAWYQSLDLPDEVRSALDAAIVDHPDQSRGHRPGRHRHGIDRRCHSTCSAACSPGSSCRSSSSTC